MNELSQFLASLIELAKNSDYFTVQSLRQQAKGAYKIMKFLSNVQMTVQLREIFNQYDKCFENILIEKENEEEK